ncbi:inositol monophosphatase 2-like [Ceratina calcarata]|nr:inositol monophosphatase 2-like [Ceratina calcarata]
MFSIRFPSKDRDLRAGRLDAVTHAARGVRFMGSAALALAFIARGALDCIYMEMLKPWDIAAGVLLIREAGGTVVDAKEKEFNIMRPNIIGGVTCELVMEIKKLIIDTDLKIMRKRLKRT